MLNIVKHAHNVMSRKKICESVFSCSARSVQPNSCMVSRPRSRCKMREVVILLAENRFFFEGEASKAIREAVLGRHLHLSRYAKFASTKREYSDFSSN